MTNAAERIRDALKKHPPSVRQVAGDGNEITLQVNYGDAALAALEASGAVDLAIALSDLLEIAHAKLPTTRAGEMAMAAARQALAHYRGEQ